MNNKYLVKIAKEFYNKEEVPDTRLSSALGGAVVGGLTAHQLDKRVGSLLQRHVALPMLTQEPKVPIDVLKRLSDEATSKTNTVLDLRQAGGSPAATARMLAASENMGPFFIEHHGLNRFQRASHRQGQLTNLVSDLAKKIVGKDVIPRYNGELGGTPTFNKNYVHMGGVRNTDILAHELGHAVDFTTGNTKLKRSISSFGRRVHGVPSAAIGGLALTNENTRDYAWTVPLIAAAPTLREEMAANLNARKLVSGAGGSAKALRGLIGRNVVSYATPAVLSAGALALINHLRKDGEKVNPEEWLSNKE